MRKLKECKGGETACIAMKDKNIWISVTVTESGKKPDEDIEVFVDEEWEAASNDKSNVGFIGIS